ncbi:MAG: 2-hydroxyacyl-CoA dehydratase [Phycisphaerae bacterium]|nr:2-hydroxyacyl-CoA dehydratase [Phycisphaerae bacterium]
MTTVAYTCPFVPAEWIRAHGLKASRIVPPGRGHGGLMEATEGLCPFARALLNDLAGRHAASPAVFTTVCDQMRRAAEVFAARCPDRPCFVMNVPATWQTPAAMGLYVDELCRLGGFLVGLGGSAPTDEQLTEVMLDHDNARRKLIAARDGLTARQYAELLADSGRCGIEAVGDACRAAQANHKTDAVPLAIVGGPLLGGHFEVFDIVERFGGRIVLDATAGGELTSPAPLDRRRAAENPLAALAEAYFGAIPHAMRRPDSMLHDYLARELAARGARGVLLHRQLWCDLWHGQLPRVRQRTALPVLDIDVADEDADFGRQAGRIQAFMEMLVGEGR